MASGNYIVEVIDSDTNKISSREIEILGPTPPSLDCNENPVSIFGQTDGEIIVSIFGGTEPYDLTISGPTTSGYPTSELNIIGPSPGHTFDNLGVGTYTVTVTDDNGVTDSVDIEITGLLNFLA